MTTFVLVHGAGHGGWCWGLVAPRLRATGHEVFTPTLTGMGERVHLLDERVDLDLHIADLVNVLRYERLDDVILVGHSYGGPVISGAADREPDRVRGLVYLDAAHVANGTSVLDGVGESVDLLRKYGTVVDGVELVLLPTPDGGPYFGVTDPDEQAWMSGRLTAFPMQCFVQPLRLDDPARLATIPAYQIVCRDSVANIPDDILDAARAADRYWEIDTNHEVMISEPEALANILLEIASRPGPLSGG